MRMTGEDKEPAPVIMRRKTMLEFYVNNQTLTLYTPVVAADALHYLTGVVHFTDEEWDGYSKWLHFMRSVEGETPVIYDVALAIGGGGAEPPLSTLGGDWGADVIPGRNKRIEWDAGADWAQHVQSNFVATVTAKRSDADSGPSDGMVHIPGGTNSGVDPDFGAYSLTVESFYMDKTEVTYAHWTRVYDWANAHGYDFDNPGSGKGLKHPVHTVSWYDCIKWCNARSEMEGLTPTYCVNGEVFRSGQSTPDVDWFGNGYRLPTPTEWEYAARGGLHGKRFPWGDTISHSQANYMGSRAYQSYDKSYNDGFHSRYNDGIYPYTAPVAAFAPNGYGLYDMAGNVHELIWNQSGIFLSRGGCWWFGGCASACRCGDGGGWAEGDCVGFRSVRRR